MDRVGIERRHICPHCGEGFSTTEVTQAELHALRRRPKPKIVEKLVTKRMTRRARLFLTRGVDVPKDKEADWKTLKTSGMTNSEAAAALGLPFFHESEILE